MTHGLEDRLSQLRERSAAGAASAMQAFAAISKKVSAFEGLAQREDFASIMDRIRGVTIAGVGIAPEAGFNPAPLPANISRAKNELS